MDKERERVAILNGFSRIYLGKRAQGLRPSPSKDARGPRAERGATGIGLVKARHHSGDILCSGHNSNHCQPGFFSKEVLGVILRRVSTAMVNTFP